MNPILGLIAASVIALSLVKPDPANAKTFGLVVGIDNYLNVNKLQGAVNDARDIASALTGRGADVTLLLDDQATRANIVGDFRRITARAKSGDVIVFSYAGHGTQEKEQMAGDETDGMDEEFILYGFSTEGPGVIERLRDNDIASLFADVPEDVTIFFIADSCHSGTMTRSPDPRGNLGRSRFVDIGPIRHDTLEPPDPSTFQLEASDMDNVVFAAAARDDQETPEVLIDGQRRGALSWSVAQALRGAADGGDGLTTLPELRTFVRTQVRAWSEARQTPDVTYSAKRATQAEETSWFGGLIALLMPGSSEASAEVSGGTEGRPQLVDKSHGGAGSLVTLHPASLAAVPELGARPSIWVRGAPAGGELATLSDVATPAPAESAADLLWDTRTGQLVDRQNADPIAEIGNLADLRAAIQKWRTVRGLIRWIGGRPLSVELDGGDERYRLGEQVWLRIRPPAPEFRYVTLVNLASTGEVQFVFPSQSLARKGADVIDEAADGFRLGPAPVVPPTGADHLIAIASRTRLAEMHAALERLDGSRQPEAVLQLLADYAARPQDARVGYVPILTER